MSELAVIATIGGIALLAALFNGIQAQQIVIQPLPYWVRVISAFIGCLLIGVILWISIRDRELPLDQSAVVSKTPTPDATAAISPSASVSVANSSVLTPTSTAINTSTPTPTPTPTVNPTNTPSPTLTIAAAVTQNPVWKQESVSIGSDFLTLNSSTDWIVFQIWDGSNLATVRHGVIEPGWNVQIPAPVQGMIWRVSNITLDELAPRVVQMRREVVERDNIPEPPLIFVSTFSAPSDFTSEIPSEWITSQQ